MWGIPVVGYVGSALVACHFGMACAIKCIIQNSYLTGTILVRSILEKQSSPDIS